MYCTIMHIHAQKIKNNNEKNLWNKHSHRGEAGSKSIEPRNNNWGNLVSDEHVIFCLFCPQEPLKIIRWGLSQNSKDM